VCDPIIWQPGFDLPRQQWSLLNHFCTEQTGRLWCRQKEMAAYRHWSVSLWQDSDDVPHCQILSSDKAEWQRILGALCRWRRCFLADQLWFMTRIWEEEEECETKIINIGHSLFTKRVVYVCATFLWTTVCYINKYFLYYTTNTDWSR